MNIFALTCTELADELARRHGKGLHHAAALCREIFRHGNFNFATAQEFKASPAFARQLATTLTLPACRITGSTDDGVVTKFTTELAGGGIVESVIIPARGRNTLCVSSQVGCRMACKFCATGDIGFSRNLTADEITWQVHAARFTFKRKIDNVVFMGMGEPLDNFANVIQAVRVLSDQRGFNIPTSHITISTAGHADGIRKLAAIAAEKPCLAVSLNAAADILRSRLMPINRSYPLTTLKKALLDFPLPKRGIIFIEYVLLAGINDSQEHADALASYLAGLPVRINIIPFNSGSTSRFTRPSQEQVSAFCNRLVWHKLFVRRRQSRGQDILAACGQLGAAQEGPQPH